MNERREVEVFVEGYKGDALGPTPGDYDALLVREIRFNGVSLPFQKAKLLMDRDDWVSVQLDFTVTRLVFRDHFEWEPSSEVTRP